MDPRATLEKGREAARAVREAKAEAREEGPNTKYPAPGLQEALDAYKKAATGTGEPAHVLDLYDVLEAFEDLDDWLSKGGFSPWKEGKQMSTEDMTRREYWEEVAALAKSITEECLDEFDAETQAEIREDNDHNDFRDALSTRSWETIDGHQWIIYTAYNFDIMRFTDNSGYSAENFGVESLVKDEELNTAAIAFGGLYADVIEHSDYGLVEASEAST